MLGWPIKIHIGKKKWVEIKKSRGWEIKRFKYFDKLLE